MPALYAALPAKTITLEQSLGALYPLGSHPHDFWEYFTTLKSIFVRTRTWHAREQMAAELHPSVSNVLVVDHLREYVADWREMVLEWPHVADGDPLKVAYTQSDRHGEADRQTVTTVGRYIKRHAPTIPDHELRDLVALVTPDTFTLTHDMAQMLRAVMDGPQSCMDGRHFDQASEHPYNAYDPAHGWGMLVRTNAQGDVMGRCVVNTGETAVRGLGSHHIGPHFVRSYGRDTPDGYSSTDQAIEAYLKNMGYTKSSRWADGLKLNKIECDHRTYLMPYLDGGSSNVDDAGDYFVIRANGDLSACSTSGAITLDQGRDCDHCGSTIYQNDDSYGAGYNENTLICEDCYQHNYVHAIGRNGAEYLAEQDECTYIESRSQYYVDNYFTSNGILETRSGDYAHEDDVILLSNDEYITEDELDDGDYVPLEKTADNGASYALESDCWQDAITGAWYVADEIEYREIRVHPDTAERQASYA